MMVAKAMMIDKNSGVIGEGDAVVVGLETAQKR
jgi:hypothetical protein